MPKGELLQKLINHDWPGNIRQLINFVKNYVLFESNISPSEIDTWLTNEMIEPHESGLTFNFARGTMEELEEAKLWLIKKILQKYDYNKAQAAKHLGMSYPGLHALIKKYDLM
jgi:DNA-binding NtrC family response regulator